MTPEEFLAWEERQELKWEFDGFQPVAMTGSSDAHAAIQVNLISALRSGLRPPCRVRGSETKVQIGSKYRYPDALVSCTPVSPASVVAAEPVVLFEITSKSTVRKDRTTKLPEYRSLASVRSYVLLEQDEVMATVYSRITSGWVVDQLLAGDTLRVADIGIEIPMALLYDDVQFPDPEGSDVLLEEG